MLRTSALLCLLSMGGFVALGSARAEGLLQYKPPTRSAPAGLIGGGTRGLTMASGGMQVLAPNHAALTSVASPVLYWYSPERGRQTVNVVMVNEAANEVLIEKNLAFDGGGYQSLRLKEHGVALKDDIEYRWSVARVEAGEVKYGGANGTGTIVYRKPGVKLTAAEDYAQGGYWYDALGMLMNDGSYQAKQQLQSLLEQGGVHTAE